MCSKKFGTKFVPNILLHRETIFGPNKYQIVELIGCVDDLEFYLGQIYCFIEGQYLPQIVTQIRFLDTAIATLICV